MQDLSLFVNEVTRDNETLIAIRSLQKRWRFYHSDVSRYCLLHTAAIGIFQLRFDEVNSNVLID